MNYIEGVANGEEDNEICVAEWVETPGNKPISCSFLKPNGGRRDEMMYTFDVSKCDRLFNFLLCGGVIQLTEGHVLPSADMLAKKKYCKWHDSFSHTTNGCNYFHRQVQSAINDGRLMMGDESRMKLASDPFPGNMIEFEQKKVLMHIDQAETTKGKNVVISYELRNQMIKPRSPEVGVWNENVRRMPTRRIKPTSSMLNEKYQR
jgi:hypothetical protein